MDDLDMSQSLEEDTSSRKEARDTPPDVVEMDEGGVSARIPRRPDLARRRVAMDREPRNK